MIPTEEILEEIRSVDEMVDGVPTSDEIREHADVSYWVVNDRFGGVVAARQAAGVDGGEGHLSENHPDLSDEEILKEVRRVSELVGRPASHGDLDEHAEYEVGTMIYRFDGMQELRESAGVRREYNHRGDREQSKVNVVCKNCGNQEQVYAARAETYKYCSTECMGESYRKHSTEDIITALVDLAEELGEAPSTKEFDRRTEFTHGVFEMRDELDSFSSELRKRGYEPRCAKDLSDEELLQNLREIAEQVGQPPTKHQLAEHGELSTIQPYRKRWGTWYNALQAAGLKPNQSRRVDIPNEELKRDFKEVAEKLGYAPSYNEIAEHSNFSAATYERAFGSFLQAKAACGFDPTRTDNQPRGEEHYAWKGGSDPQYGKSWRRQREKAVKRDSYACQSCGIEAEEHKQKTGVDLHVHHITPWDEFDNHEERNKLSNLITLCASCHRKWENLPVKPQMGAD